MKRSFIKSLINSQLQLNEIKNECIKLENKLKNEILKKEEVLKMKVENERRSKSHLLIDKHRSLKKNNSTIRKLTRKIHFYRFRYNEFRKRFF